MRVTAGLRMRSSFRPGEITPEEANRLGVEFAKRFTKGNHAFVVCTHIDKSHIHNHIIWSSVSLEYDRKFRNFWGSTKAVRRLSDTICIENELSIVENPKPHGFSILAICFTETWLRSVSSCCVRSFFFGLPAFFAPKQSNHQSA